MTDSKSGKSSPAAPLATSAGKMFSLRTVEERAKFFEEAMAHQDRRIAELAKQRNGDNKEATDDELVMRFVYSFLLRCPDFRRVLLPADHPLIVSAEEEAKMLSDRIHGEFLALTDRIMIRFNASAGAVTLGELYGCNL